MSGNNIRIGASVPGAKKAASDLDSLKDRITKLKTEGAKGAAIGVGFGAVGLGIGLAKQAVSEFTDVIGDSISAAVEDEASQQKLGVALKDNIPSWNGNTNAIEKTIKARMALGFADEDQRAGLATLVASTHDETKALELERGAMDIVRARGLDLGTVTDALSKAYAGNTKQLKTLIPGLKLGATAAETIGNAFAAVQGQAEAYTETAAGKMAVAQTQINEAMETFGYTILPVVAEALTDVSYALDQTTIPLQKLNEAATRGDVRAKLRLQNIPRDVQLAGKALDDLAGAPMQSVQDLGGAMQDTGDEAKTMARKTAASATRIADDLKTAADDAIDEFFDPIEAEYDRLDAHQRAHTAKQEGDSKGLQDALKDEGTALIDLADHGKASKKKLSEYAHDIKSAYGKIPPELQKILDKIEELSHIRGTSVNVKVTHETVGGRKRLARGGSYSRGDVLTVGEEGEETMVAGHSGNVIPNGGGGDNYYVTFTGNITGTERGVRTAIQGLQHVSGRKASSYDRVSIR